MRSSVLALALVALAFPTSALADGNDQRVADLLAKNLKSSNALQGFQVRVKFRDGTARLHGWVRNQHQMDEAVAIAERTPQVDRVMNFLEIQQAATPAPRPATFTPEPFVHEAPQPSMVRQAGGQQPTKLKPVPQGKGPQLEGTPAPQPQNANWGRTAQGAPVRVARQMPQRPMAIGYTHGGHPAHMAHHPYYASQMAAAYQPVGRPVPAYPPGVGGGAAPALYDQPNLPNYAWPTYAAYPNYGALTYPKQYSPTAWPYIGPFYPYPQVPLGWRKVTLEWDDGWWFLDFSADRRHCCGQ